MLYVLWPLHAADDVVVPNIVAYDEVEPPKLRPPASRGDGGAFRKFIGGGIHATRTPPHPQLRIQVVCAFEKRCKQPALCFASSSAHAKRESVTGVVESDNEKRAPEPLREAQEGL